MWPLRNGPKTARGTRTKILRTRKSATFAAVSKTVTPRRNNPALSARLYARPLPARTRSLADPPDDREQLKHDPGLSTDGAPRLRASAIIIGRLLIAVPDGSRRKIERLTVEWLCLCRPRNARIWVGHCALLREPESHRVPGGRRVHELTVREARYLQRDRVCAPRDLGRLDGSGPEELNGWDE